MPFPITLERDSESGFDRYVVVAARGFGPAEARELCDWLAAAAQNPTATFRLDLSALDATGSEFATVVAATHRLQLGRRLEIVTPAPAAAA